MTIDEDAPVLAHGHVKIAASPAIVWDVLATFDDWPVWNPDVRSVSVDGPVTPGTRFRWRAGPGMITSTLQEVVRPQRIVWEGDTMGIHAVHVWTIEDIGDGWAAVGTHESWRGLPARVLRRSMQRRLERSMEAGLGRLKAEAERRETARAVAA